MKKDQIIKDRNHLEMMRSPDLWPRWPYLPIKRSRGHDVECKVLVATNPPTIIDTNLWMITGQEERTVVDPEQLVADGWEVD